MSFFQVAAQTGHKVTLVDISQDVLDKSAARIGESIKRVAKKQFKEDQVNILTCLDCRVL